MHFSLKHRKWQFKPTLHSTCTCSTLYSKYHRSWLCGSLLAGSTLRALPTKIRSMKFVLMKKEAQHNWYVLLFPTWILDSFSGQSHIQLFRHSYCAYRQTTIYTHWIISCAWVQQNHCACFACQLSCVHYRNCVRYEFSCICFTYKSCLYATLATTRISAYMVWIQVTLECFFI